MIGVEKVYLLYKRGYIYHSKANTPCHDHPAKFL